MKANEKLYLRLPVSAEQPVHWLVWNSSHNELIASGVLASVNELEQLTGQAQQRSTVVFVASQPIAMRQVTLPNGSHRHLAQVIPFALEEELASDIESLHFAWPQNVKQTPLPVMVVAHDQMQQWQQWLADAGIRADAMYPDIFMVPSHAGSWQLLPLQPQDIVVRTGAWTGFTVETELFEHIANQLVTDAAADGPVADQLVHYGDFSWPAEQGESPIPLVAADIEVPLSVVAQSASTLTVTGINLLQGKYRQKQKRRRSTKSWRPLAVAAGVVAVLGLSLQITQWVQLERQSENLQAAIEQTYRDTFPNETRIVNVRTQLSRHLQQVQGGGNEQDVLQLLQYLQPAFAAHPNLRLELIRFERGELRLQVNGESFEDFEGFRREAEREGQLNVAQGQVSNRDDRVSGTLTVTLVTG